MTAQPHPPIATVRAFYDAFRVPGAAAPCDTAQLKVYYPAVLTGSELERNQGVVLADRGKALFPVAIFLPGVNIAPHTYTPLACALAALGFAVAVPQWVAQQMPGRVSITPGISMDALRHGERPSAMLIAPILDLLAAYHTREHHLLAGTLDLTRVVFGGHSAGGTMAVYNAREAWFPGVVGAFAFVANPLATFALVGHTDGAFPAPPGDVPAFVIAAEHDGIGDHHNDRFGRPGRPAAETLRALFDAIPRAHGDVFYGELRGANHHTVCAPVDQAIGRRFLDHDEGTGPDAPVTAALTDAIAAFAGAAAAPDAAARTAAFRRLGAMLGRSEWKTSEIR